MVSKSTARRSKEKPARPEGFPLFVHNNGQWAKRIKGRLYCFGIWDDPEAARQKYLDEKEYLEAGRKPPTRKDGLRLVDAVNRFLTVKHHEVKSGELTQRSWNDYDTTTKRVEAVFGRDRLVEDLAPEDFEELKAELAKGRNLTTLGNEVQRVRTVFKYLWEAGLIPAPAKFGPTFKRPSKKARRRLRNEREPLLYTAAEVRSMLEAAHPTLRAMILLAVNSGFGNTDLARLPMGKLDLDNGRHSFGRPETGVARCCPLWPDTVDALRVVLDSRPKAKDPVDADLVFLTRHGRPYVRLQAKQNQPEPETGTPPATVWNDAISRECDKLLRKLNMKRPGLSFYSLRRTFRTIAARVGDEPAATFIMGHADADSSMTSVYVQERPDDKRLGTVVDYVYAWLFPSEAGDGQADDTSQADEEPATVKFPAVG